MISDCHRFVFLFKAFVNNKVRNLHLAQIDFKCILGEIIYA